MTLGELHKEISAELKRGTSLDSVIPSKVREAVQFLERNHPMKYMERFVDIQLAKGERMFDLPFIIRNFRFLRMVPVDGVQLAGYGYLKQMNTRDELFENSLSGLPTGFSQIGNKAIRLNTEVGAPLKLEGLAYIFSDWQTSQPTFRHFLLDVASDLLKGQALMHMAIHLKDQRMIAAYRVVRDEALKTFYSMDNDMAEGEANGQMEYSSIYS